MLLPLIKKINKGIGHIRFTSIIAHVVLITVIKSYLSQISGWKCHDLQLKTHWKFHIFQLHSFSFFTKSGRAIFFWLIGLEVSLIAIYQQKCTFLFLATSWKRWISLLYSKWMIAYFYNAYAAFSFCSAISALENSDLKGIFNDKLKIYQRLHNHA